MTWVKRIFIVLMALAFSQFPAFENSYSQNLAGHVDELRYQMDQIEEIATRSGKTVDEFIHKFESNSDADFQRLGTWMRELRARLIALENAQFNLEKASRVARPFVFMLYSDKIIAKSAFQKYRFSVPISVEGVVWAVLGAFVGYLVFSVFAWGYHKTRKKEG